MSQPVALFAGYDASGLNGLWVTNGTAAGTYELASFYSVFADGPANSQLTAFNGEVLFNADGQGDLWVTNGTAAGTHELTALPGYPYDMTVFNGDVLFGCGGLLGPSSLWVTNGTAAGTHELTGIAGAYTGGLDPFDMTVFNGEVLFAGKDASGNYSLWVTNGTAAGTYELTGASGASYNGITLSDMTAFNGEVLFDGVSASSLYGLWVTNGTAAGTYELTGITGAWSTFAPYDMTVFNGEVLFNGTNENIMSGLWVTNGTAAGTHELTGITGANPFGVDPTDMTVFNGEMLFNGCDTNGQYSLWVTNGTAAGTHELTGIVGAYTGGDSEPSGGSPGGLDPSNMTVLNGSEVLFTGYNKSDVLGLWVTDGTAAGTHEITGISNVSSSGVDPWDITGFTTGAGAVGPSPATVQQEIAGLYVTLYGLAATQAGINYWINAVSAFDPGITAANAGSTSISAADEVYLGQQMTAGSPIVNGTTYFQTVYPSTMTDLAYVEALYQNMSGFIGTVAGDQYWLNLLQQAEAGNGGNITLAREAIVGQFAHDFYSDNLTVGATALGVSASDYALLVAGQQTLQNKVTVAQYWATETGVTGGGILNFTSVTDPSFAAAQHVLAGITSDPSTVTVAITGINNAVAHQNLSLV